MSEQEDYSRAGTLGAHKTTHEDGGSDQVNVAGLSGRLADDQHVLDAEVKLIKLDGFATPDDNTLLNASTSRHGLLRKLSNVATQYLNGQGGWSTPPDTTVPYAHRTTHQDGGADQISVADLLGRLADDQHVLDAEVKLIKLDDFAAPDDNADLNASTSKHGLLKKLSNVVTEFLNGEGGWTVPAGGGGGDVYSGLVVRSKFRWLSVTQIYIGSGEYHHSGTVDQKVYWDTELTYTVLTNASPGWVYIYIDDSAVVSLGTNLLTNAEFIDSLTEPIWNAAKKGHYNGLDRCIHAVYLVENDVVEFFHDGNTVLHADKIENQSSIDIDTAFTDIGALIIPKFTTLGIVTFHWEVLAEGWYWRTNGQSGTIAHGIGYAENGREAASVLVITDAAQIIEVKGDASDTSQISCYTDAWKFPVGM